MNRFKVLAETNICGRNHGPQRGLKPAELVELNAALKRRSSTALHALRHWRKNRRFLTGLSPGSE